MEINSELQLELGKDLMIPPAKDGRAFYKALCEKVGEMINNDFSKLVQLLYRMDVSEEKLRNLLLHKPDQDAATLIAELMIERQLQKIKSRKENKRTGNIPEEDAW